jgi:hypothetical protein
MQPLDEFAPVKLTLHWGTPGKSSVFMIELPWDADGNAFAEAFQSLMAAYGFCESTIKDYVESNLMNREADGDDDEDPEGDLLIAHMDGYAKGAAAGRKATGGPEEGLQDD